MKGTMKPAVHETLAAQILRSIERSDRMIQRSARLAPDPSGQVRLVATLGTRDLPTLRLFYRSWS